MTSSSPFANTGKLQVLPSNTTLLFTPSINNNTGNSTQFIRQASTHNGTLIQQPVSSGIVTTPSTSIVRVNQPQQNQGQFLPQSIWTNSPSQQQFTVQKTTQPTSVLQYTTVKNEPGTPAGIQTQSSVIPTKVLTQPVVRQAVPSQGNTTVYTESQINDFVSKCRTFLTTLLRLAEKQAPEKLPMVRSCIQELLDGTIDPESFTQRLHTLYKSQPHVSLVPFFKLALPHMREIVKNTFGRPITIDLLEKLQLPPSSSSTTTTANNNNSITTSTVSNTRPGTATNVVVNPSLLSQTQNSSVLQQPLYTTVQPQQKINILQQAPQPTLIGSTGSLLSQQQQQQQQARAQIFQGITGIRPLVASLSTSTNPSLLSNHQTTQQVQPVTQMIIQPQTDSVLQRSFLSSTNPIQSTQIITVNHQPIKTETLHTHPTPTTISSIHQKGNFKIEDDYINDNNRQLIHDDRFISAMNIRRRFDSLDKDIRTSGLVLNDDGAFELISNGVRERLKYLLEQVRLIAQHRVDISMKNDSSYQTTSDVKSQIRFLEDLDKIEKQKKDKLEQEKIFRAAKSRSKTNDPEAAKLKQKAKEMQQAQVEEQRQKEANETALAAIGKPKKRKLEESTNQLTTHTNGSEQISPIQPSPLSNVVSTNVINSKTKPAKRMCRANLRDLLLIMERDKYLKRTTLLVKALNK